MDPAAQYETGRLNGAGEPQSCNLFRVNRCEYTQLLTLCFLRDIIGKSCSC